MPLGCALAFEIAWVLERNLVYLFDDQLCDWHSGTKDEVARTQVDNFEGQRSLEPWMHGGSGKMNQDTAPRDTTPTLDPCRETPFLAKCFPNEILVNKYILMSIQEQI